MEQYSTSKEISSWIEGQSPSDLLDWTKRVITTYWLEGFNLRQRDRDSTPLQDFIESGLAEQLTQPALTALADALAVITQGWSWTNFDTTIFMIIRLGWYAESPNLYEALLATAEVQPEDWPKAYHDLDLRDPIYHYKVKITEDLIGRLLAFADKDKGLALEESKRVYRLALRHASAAIAEQTTRYYCLYWLAERNWRTLPEYFCRLALTYHSTGRQSGLWILGRDTGHATRLWNEEQLSEAKTILQQQMTDLHMMNTDQVEYCEEALLRGGIAFHSEAVYRSPEDMGDWLRRQSVDSLADWLWGAVNHDNPRFVPLVITDFASQSIPKLLLALNQEDINARMGSAVSELITSRVVGYDRRSELGSLLDIASKAKLVLDKDKIKAAMPVIVKINDELGGHPKFVQKATALLQAAR